MLSTNHGLLGTRPAIVTAFCQVQNMTLRLDWLTCFLLAGLICVLHPVSVVRSMCVYLSAVSVMYTIFFPCRNNNTFIFYFHLKQRNMLILQVVSQKSRENLKIEIPNIFRSQRNSHSFGLVGLISFFSVQETDKALSFFLI